MYTREYVVSEINVTIKNNNLADWYKLRCINWNGKTIDTQESYTEVIAETLLKAGIVNRFDKGITTIKRNKPFNANHQGTTSANQTRMDEARYAIALYNQKSLGLLGKVIDYQVPLKNKQSDGAGKIDLISYDAASNTVYLIELKKKDNVETLLRCTLEIETYYRQIDKNKLLDDYNLSQGPEKNIKTASLIFENSRQHDALKQIHSMPNVKALINNFGTSIFIISSNSKQNIGINDDPSLLPGIFKPVLTPLGIIPTVYQIFP